MSKIGEKLYPPIINGTLPAFYGEENGDGTTTAEIVVPFSMNRAVSSSEIGGFSLKIKTVQSNTLIDIISASSEATQSANESRVVSFLWTVSSKVKIGQFLKVQLAYIQKNTGTIGYYSTVGIIKYTTKPNVYIEGFQNEPNRIETFRSRYTGVYEPTGDKSERPYSYNFSLYDEDNLLVETSGWLLHNTSINNVVSESLSLDRTTDTYAFNAQVTPDKAYYLQYSVKTINNLEVDSPTYSCQEPYIGASSFKVLLNANNIFEEGYVNVSLKLNPAEDETILNVNELRKLYNAKDVTYNETTSKYTILKEDNSTFELSKLSLKDPISIEICRSEKTDGFSSWRVLQRVYFSSYDYAVNRWSFKDFTVEQGVTYQYCFRQYNDKGIQSERSLSNEVVADFEDMFLWDGQKQLKVRFNPKVTSFKTNHLEQKIDTIGSRYPFIFRNGKVEYKEFPISGLISYIADNNELFINHQDDLNIILGPQASRNRGTPVNQKLNDTAIGKSWETSETLDSLGYNMRAERKFKLKLMDWLGNGEIKMFRSPAEGNYLVRLLNVSLSPEDKLGRMLHSFTCTAYEVEEFTYNNLVDLGFLTPNDSVTTEIATKSIYLKDLFNKDMDLSKMIKINDSPIFEYFKIDNSNDNTTNKLYVRIGIARNAKTEIAYGAFELKSKNRELPNLYFYPSDHEALFSSEDSNVDKVNKLIDLVGDTIVTYQYYDTVIQTGDFNNIKDVYLTNTIETFVGPGIKTFTAVESRNSEGHTETKETLKFFVLNFREKERRTITKDENGSYLDEQSNIITQWDRLTIYQVVNNKGEQVELIYINNNGNITTNDTTEEPKTEVKLTTSDNQRFEFDNPPPLVNLNQYFYNSIEIGDGVYAEYACQDKVIEYKS